LLDFWDRARRRLADTRLARRLAEAVFRAQSRRHLTYLDRLDAGRCQTRVLLGLLRQARATRFGIDHDFRRIRTVEDFRRLVPLCPRAVPGTPPEAPLAPALLAAHRAALRTALASLVHARPRARLLSGTILALGGDNPTAAAEMPPGLGLPYCLRPYVVREPAAGQNVTCLLGPPPRLAALIDHMRQTTGRERLSEVWPGLTAVLAFTTADAPLTADSRRSLGASVLVLEVLLCPEGPVAVEDPRHGALRLLPDHGVFFEFVPLSQAHSPCPERFGIDQVEGGRPYELVLTSPAGVWACRSGRAVVFERTEPPLLRFVETVPQPPERTTEAGTETRRAREETPSGAPGPRPAPVTPPPPHRQNGGIPAVPPERLARSPWLIPVDRG
jgi:hypothetical protein